MGGPIDIKQKGWRSVIYDNDPDLLKTEVKHQDDWTVTGVTLDVDVLLTRLVRFQPWSVDFPHFGGILTKQVKFGFPGIFWETNADVSWPPSELIRFWSWSVDFPNFVMSPPWLNAHLTGLWQLRGAAVIIS